MIEPSVDRGAYGVVNAVFQWGWGRNFSGLEGPIPIESYVPMMMFAVLFGLHGLRGLPVDRVP